MLRAAFGQARANGIIVFFVILGAAWFVLALLEKAVALIKEIAGEDASGVSMPDANSSEVILAVGVVLLFAVIYGWTATRREYRRELKEIKSDIALIKNRLGITDDESMESDDGKVHTDD